CLSRYRAAEAQTGIRSRARLALPCLSRPLPEMRLPGSQPDRLLGCSEVDSPCNSPGPRESAQRVTEPACRGSPIGLPELCVLPRRRLRGPRFACSPYWFARAPARPASRRHRPEEPALANPALLADASVLPIRFWCFPIALERGSSQPSGSRFARG